MDYENTLSVKARRQSKAYESTCGDEEEPGTQHESPVPPDARQEGASGKSVRRFDADVTETHPRLGRRFARLVYHLILSLAYQTLKSILLRSNCQDRPK
jgi:hypothetical protein